MDVSWDADRGEKAVEDVRPELPNPLELELDDEAGADDPKSVGVDEVPSVELTVELMLPVQVVRVSVLRRPREGKVVGIGRSKSARSQSRPTPIVIRQWPRIDAALTTTH